MNQRYLSDRVLALKPSGIRRFFDIAATMKDVISLGIGEPDFVTPEPILQAGIRSLNGGETHYTSNSGHLELRQALSAPPGPAVRRALRPGDGVAHHRRRLRGAVPGPDRHARPRRRGDRPDRRASSPTRPEVALAGGVPVASRLPGGRPVSR